MSLNLTNDGRNPTADKRNMMTGVVRTTGSIKVGYLIRKKKKGFNSTIGLVLSSVGRSLIFRAVALDRSE